MTPNLADPQLANHTRYNSFKFVKEDNLVKLRAKKLPQSDDDCLHPRAGIDLLKDDVVFEPVGPAEFRGEEINFDRIFVGIKKVTARLQLEERMLIQSSWDNLRHRIECMPGKKENLKKMDLENLPKQQLEGGGEGIIGEDENVDGDQVIVGNLCPETIEEGDVDQEIEVGMDVCVYTKNKKSRPWVGRVSELLPDNRFVIHWYQRRGRGNTFHALKNFDESPFLTEQDYESIMFWDMSEKRKESSFDISNFWLLAFNHEYEKIDKKET